MLTFDRPLYLLLFLPISALFWLVALRSDAPLARDQVWQSLALRLAAALLIVAAIAGPSVRQESRDQAVTYLVDVSRSISPAERAREFEIVRRAIAAKPKDDSAGVIEFAGDPAVLARPAKDAAAPPDHVAVNDESTDIGSAVRAAAAVAPASGGKQIVLISDGNDTGATGSALAAAQASDMPVSAVDPDRFLGSAPPEASVAHVDLPPSVREGEPLNVRALVSSSEAQTATITVKADGRVIRTTRVALAAGKSVAQASVVLHGGGVQQIEVGIDAPRDTLLENNHASAMVQVIGKPRILYLADQPSRIAPTLQQAMQRQSIVLDIRPAAQAPTDVAGFAGYQSVVLSNISSSELTVGQQSALQSAVRDFGVGLGMVGGTDSFVGGGWRDTPVEAALPVLMKPRQDEKMPSADIVVVLDASSSMSREEGGVQKVQLAARAAVSLLGALQPGDRVAVIAVTETPTVVTPFTSPKNALAAKKDIEGVEANGGGIYCLVALQAAYNLLDSSHAAIKHVIICPDTDDSEQQQNCVPLARTLRLTEHVTTSVCGIGDAGDRDVAFQRQLADAGGGQLFIVNQASNLPQFFQRDLSHFETPPFVEGRFTPRIDPTDRVVAGLNAASEPPLLGYNIVAARPDAHVAMRAPTKPDPILAYRAYGLGRTFAFTSDESDHWAAKWLPWPGYAQMWSQVLRWSLRSGKQADFQAFAEVDAGSGQGHVIVDAFSPNGAFLNGASFAAVVAAPSSGTRRVELAQTAPGRYEASFQAKDIGAYLLSVSRRGAPGSGQAILGASRPYPAEYAQTGPNRPLLAQLAAATGGRIFSDASDAWKFRPGGRPSAVPLGAICLLLGALVFIADIAWRRLGLRVRTQRIVAPALTLIDVAAAAGGGAVRSAREIASKPRSAAREPKRAALQGRSAEDILTSPVGRRIRIDDERDGLDTSGAAGGSENPFPLVASLDDLRRRERARDSGGDKRGSA